MFACCVPRQVLQRCRQLGRPPNTTQVRSPGSICFERLLGAQKNRNEEKVSFHWILRVAPALLGPDVPVIQ
eukprot:376915-Amphidinium_carterae.2